MPTVLDGIADDGRAPRVGWATRRQHGPGRSYVSDRAPELRPQRVSKFLYTHRGTTMSESIIGYFVGSLAKESINRKLALALARLAPDELTLREIPIGDLPLYSYDYDADYPPAARALKDAIAAVDAVLFVTPEYNRSIPGALKNAIDWASRLGNRTRSPANRRR